MTPEKEEYLFRTYPSVFNRSHERFSTGFNCEDGWFELIETMATWIAAGRYENLRVIGVKEKFGHIVVDVENESLEDVFRVGVLLEGYYTVSASICERCGTRKDPSKDHCKPMNAFHPRR